MAKNTVVTRSLYPLIGIRNVIQRELVSSGKLWRGTEAKIMRLLGLRVNPNYPLTTSCDKDGDKTTTLVQLRFPFLRHSFMGTVLVLCLDPKGLQHIIIISGED